MISLLICAGAPVDDRAQAISDDASVQSEELWSERDAITGDWWGARTELKNAGLTISGEYIAEYSGVLSGGIRERGAFRNLLTVDAELDLESAFGLEGGTIFAQYLSVNPERGGSADAGDIQVYSNIENDTHLDVLYELWWERSLFEERLRFKLGKVDANSEFAFVDLGNEFAHSSAGFSPTIFVFPSYPDPAFSLNIFGTVLDTGGADLTLAYGLYDGAAQDGTPTGSRGPSGFGDKGLFHIAQATLRWHAPDEPGGGWLREGRISAGAWHHSAEDIPRFDGGTENGAHGLFLTFEQRVWACDQRDEAGLHLIAQYGWADETVSEFAQHIGAGLVLRGVLPGRRSDSAGVYISYADLSDDPAAGFEKDEIAIDAYYRVQATPAVFVQPELQYIFNPSGDPGIDDAVVAGVRLGIRF